MALRTRHIWFILHLFEIRFITRPVIPMDKDGLRWIPMDPIGFRRIGIGGYHPTTFLPGPLWFSSDFRYSSASNVSYFRWKVLRIESCLFHRKTTFPLVCIGKVWQKVNIYLVKSWNSISKVTGDRVCRLNNSANDLLDNFLIFFMLNDPRMCMKICSKIRPDNIRDQIVTGGWGT